MFVQSWYGSRTGGRALVVASVFLFTSFAVLTSSKALADEAVAAAEIEEVVVRAHPLSAEGLTQSAISLDGDALARRLAPNLGEVLATQPGIHSSSFGAAVGRPVIHGLGGARVMMMEDRLGTMDVSVTSGDHATTVEPFIADSVEVLKGPSTLLYGNGAVGGVVDVHTGRVPHGQRGEGISGRVSAQGSDNEDEHAVAGRLDGRSDAIAWHIDAFDRRSSNYEIPGEAESAALIAQEEAEGEPHDEDEEAEGVLPGSHFSTDGGAFGISYVSDNWFSGIAISQLNAVYGLPGGHGHHHEDEHEDEDHEDEHEDEEHGDEEDHADHEEEGTPILDLEQQRIDIEVGRAGPLGNSQSNLFASSIESINFRLGINDYEHAEIEPNGEVATFFENDELQARIEVTHAFTDSKHVWGLQLADREFSVTGEEAFVPAVDSENLGAFWLSERDLNNLAVEMGLRVEQVEHKDQSSGSKKDFTATAGSVGVIYPINTDLTLTVNLGYAERAPVGEELFSNGPHLASGRFEIGNANLDEETVVRTDVLLGWAKSNVEVNLNAYYASFDDFIYQNPTGAEMDELPVFLWSQADAKFRGLDGELRWSNIQVAGGDLALRGFFDVIRTSLDTASERELPLIPADRIGLSLTQQWGDITLILEAMHVTEQDDVPSYELPTDSFNDYDAHLEWRPTLANGQAVTVFLRGENLSDDEQRLHTSFIKDSAPQRGRTWTLGARYQF